MLYCSATAATWREPYVLLQLERRGFARAQPRQVYQAEISQVIDGADIVRRHHLPLVKLPQEESHLVLLFEDIVRRFGGILQRFSCPHLAKGS